jgi:hypothetical protein
MPDDRQPLRDVYSGDLTTATNPVPLVRAVFEVRADADPGTLPRVAAMLALANVVPLRVTCDREPSCEILITSSAGWDLCGFCGVDSPQTSAALRHGRGDPDVGGDAAAGRHAADCRAVKTAILRPVALDRRFHDLI